MGARIGEKSVATLSKRSRDVFDDSQPPCTVGRRTKPRTASTSNDLGTAIVPSHASPLALEDETEMARSGVKPSSLCSTWGAYAKSNAMLRECHFLRIGRYAYQQKLPFSPP